MAENPFHQTNGATNGAASEPAPSSLLFGTPPEPAPAAQAPTPNGDKPAADPTQKPSKLFGEAEKGDNGWKKGDPLNQHPRFQEVVGEAKDLRKQVETLTAQQAELGKFKEALAGQYKKDPFTEFQWDMKFLGAWEQLQASDPAVRAAAVKVRQFMETGEVQRPATSEPAPAAQTQQPARDPVVQRLLEREATTQTMELLTSEGIQPKFAKMIAEHVLASARDLSALDGDQIAAAARGWIESHDFTYEELTGKRRDAGRQPPSRGTSSAAAAPNGGAAEPEERPKGDASMWDRNKRQALVDKTARELGLT